MNREQVEHEALVMDLYSSIRSGGHWQEKLLDYVKRELITPEEYLVWSQWGEARAAGTGGT